MKYPCNMIKDLLPLYHDAICSDESRTIVAEHLSECAECRQYYEMLMDSDSVEKSAYDAENEVKKAFFIHGIKRRVRNRQIIAIVIAVAILIAIVISVLGILEKTESVIEYADNISVQMVDDDLIARIEGSNHSGVHIKRISIQGNDYLIFCVYQTKLDALITDKDLISEIVLCASDKGADSVNGVYYYTGDDTGLESMNADEIQEILKDAVLLWNHEE